MFGNVGQCRQKKLERCAVGGALKVAAERVKEPKRRVCRVIFPFLCAIGKHVWDQTVADIIRECAQDVACFEPTSRDQRQTFQADHRVASPICEPVIPGDDGAHFVAGGVRAGRLLEAACGRNDKLVGRENQFRRKTLAHFWDGSVKQTRAPFAFGRENVFGTQDVDNIPWLG